VKNQRKPRRREHLRGNDIPIQRAASAVVALAALAIAASVYFTASGGRLAGGRIGHVPSSAYAACVYVFLLALGALGLRLKSANARRAWVALLLVASSLDLSVTFGRMAMHPPNLRSVRVLYIALDAALLAIGVRAARRTGETLAHFVRVELSAWAAHSEWFLVPLGGLLMAALITLAAFSQSPVDCGPLSDALGSKRDARQISIVVYEDFRCAPCRASDAALRVATSDERVRVEHRQYPLDPTCNPQVPGPGHEGACLLARAAICATQLGHEPDLHDRLFDAPADRKRLVELASAAQVDADAFGRCLDAPDTTARLQHDLAAAEADAVAATPTFIIDGKRVVGELRSDEMACVLGRDDG
jgi:Thioredoxin